MKDLKKVLVGSAAFSVLGIISLYGGSASAATINVQDETELRNAIDQVNTSITEDTVISITKDISTTTAFVVNKTNAHNVEINGNDHLFQATFNLNSSGGGKFTFDHMNMDGKKTVRAGINMTNFLSDVVIQNSKFQNLDNTAVDSTTNGNMLLIKNSFFRNNKSAGGGALNISNTRTITIENSSFEENLNTSGGYYGGAIVAKQYNGKFVVKNSKFIRNKATGPGTVASGGGAVFMMQNGPNTKVDFIENYFEGNETNLEVKNNERLDGGAISIFNYNKDSSVNIEGSTFYRNKSGDDGGAILLQAKAVNTHTTLSNNTFMENKALGQGSEDGFSGGAIQLFGTRDGGFTGGAEIVSKNNTFYKNYSAAPYDGQIQKGGALASSGFRRGGKHYNDLLLGNYVENSGVINNESFNRALYVMTNSKHYETLGFDNGKKITDYEEEAYGKLPVLFSTNRGKVKAGYDGDESVIPTVPIVPRFNQYNEDALRLGIANMTGDIANGPSVDQRGYDRVGISDVGAVEIASTLYDANGGNFSLTPLEIYDGTKYYEGSKPIQYASVGTPDYTEKIIDGKTTLKATKSGVEFLGWSTDKDATEPDALYNAGTKHKVDDQLVLYAVWGKKAELVTVKYFGNSNTSGVVPVQKKVTAGTEITLKDQYKLKRKGYKFKGWALKATVSNDKEVLKSGTKYVVKKNKKFYAVWKRA